MHQSEPREYAEDGTKTALTQQCSLPPRGFDNDYLVHTFPPTPACVTIIAGDTPDSRDNMVLAYPLKQTHQVIESAFPNQQDGLVGIHANDFRRRVLDRGLHMLF